MPTSEEMIAHGRTVEEVADVVGADSLAYLSLEGVYEAVGSGRATHCDACFTGRLSARGHRARERQARFGGTCRRQHIGRPRAGPAAGFVAG